MAAPLEAGLPYSQKKQRLMIVARIRLRNFRNHDETSLEFGDGINVLLGDNGEGKTNILEAVSYLSLTKSFYASADRTVLQIGKDFFDLEGVMVSSGGRESRVHVRYSCAGEEKRYEVDRVRPERLASVIGRFPIVILSPENGAITSGVPGERRKFVDLILSQVSPLYLDALLEYRRVLRQRNRILLESRLQGSYSEGALEAWDDGLARHGAFLISRRAQFVKEFREYLQLAYADLVREGTEKPAMEYRSSGAGLQRVPAEGDVAARLLADMKEHRAQELRRGTSLVGPHRDDFQLMLGGITVSQYASQGQHKTLLVALKVAEFRYLREHREEPPIVLLDDVFSELDAHRGGRIMTLVAGLGQVLVTTTDERVFPGTVSWGGTNRRFRVDHGTVREV